MNNAERLTGLRDQAREISIGLNRARREERILERAKDRIDKRIRVLEVVIGRAVSTPFEVQETIYGFTAESRVYIGGEYVGYVSYYTDASNPKVCVATAEGTNYSFHDIRRGLTRSTAKKVAARMRIRLVRHLRQKQA